MQATLYTSLLEHLLHIDSVQNSKSILYTVHLHVANKVLVEYTVASIFYHDFFVKAVFYYRTKTILVSGQTPVYSKILYMPFQLDALKTYLTSLTVQRPSITVETDTFLVLAF